MKCSAEGAEACSDAVAAMRPNQENLGQAPGTALSELPVQNLRPDNLPTNHDRRLCHNFVNQTVQNFMDDGKSLPNPTLPNSKEARRWSDSGSIRALKSSAIE